MRLQIMPPDPHKATTPEEFREKVYGTDPDEVYRVLLVNREEFVDEFVEYYLWLEDQVNNHGYTISPARSFSLLNNLIRIGSSKFHPVFSKTLKTPSAFRTLVLHNYSWYNHHQAIPVHLFNDYFEAVKETEIYEHLDSLLAYKKVPAELINRIISESPVEIIRRFPLNGRDSRFSEESMQILVGSNHPWVVTELALNRKATPAILRQLAQSDNEWVRRKVGLNINTPPDVLERLANDRLLTVKVGVAKNPGTPVPCLWQLAGTGSKQVMNSLNKNPTWLDIMEENKQKGKS